MNAKKQKADNKRTNKQTEVEADKFFQCLLHKRRTCFVSPFVVVVAFTWRGSGGAASWCLNLRCCATH